MSSQWGEPTTGFSMTRDEHSDSRQRGDEHAPRRPGPRRGNGKQPLRGLRVSEREWRHWFEYARQQGTNVSALIREVMNRATGLEDGEADG